MAVVSRYRGKQLYEDKQGNSYARRYKRLDKNREYFVIITDKLTTLDIIALQQYGSPLMYWAIADFNDMLDPTVTIQPGTSIKIPRI